MAELIIPPRLRQKHYQGLAHYLSTGEGPGLNRRIEFTAMRASGSEFPVELAICRVPIEGPPLFTGYIRDLGERRRAEVELKGSQSRLAGIIASAMDGIITVDGKQRIVLFNAAAERMFGYRADQLMGQPLSRLIPERFRKAHSGHVRGFGETGVTNRQMGALGTIYGLRADGTEFPLEASISQVDADGQKLFTVILRDITGRNQAEEGLREGQERIRAIVDTAVEGIITIDQRGAIESVNPAQQ